MPDATPAVAQSSFLQQIEARTKSVLANVISGAEAMTPAHFESLVKGIAADVDAEVTAIRSDSAVMLAAVTQIVATLAPIATALAAVAPSAATELAAVLENITGIETKLQPLVAAQQKAA